MRSVPASFVAGLLLSVIPTSCGKGVDERAYAHAKDCEAVLEASLVIVPAVHLSAHAKFDPGAIQAVSEDYLEGALGEGSKTGMPREAIYKDLEQAKRAYLNSYTSRTTENPRQKLLHLFDDINRCTLPQ